MISTALRSQRDGESTVGAPSRKDRRHRRFELPETREHPCRDGEGNICLLKDISQGGLGFFSNQSFNRGEYLDLHIMDYLRVQVRVQYREPMPEAQCPDTHHHYRYGACFGEQVMSPASLASFLEHYLAAVEIEPNGTSHGDGSGATG